MCIRDSYRAFTYASWVLSAVSALVALVPFVYIWMILRLSLIHILEFYEYPDGSGYEGRFTKCGICVLMKELGLYDLTPALCHLDYTCLLYTSRCV